MAEEKKKIEDSRIAYKVLIEPWVTEKATQAAELNKYVFKISAEASKIQVKDAIESLYKVTVLSVNVVNIPRKKRTRGRTTGWKAGVRKAIVTLKDGDSIEYFDEK